MVKITMIITHKPSRDDPGEPPISIIKHATSNADDVTAYLLGDGVLLARLGPGVEEIRGLLSLGVKIKASARDLRARGITGARLVNGIEPIEDIEGAIVDRAMEECGKVISW